MNIKDKIEKGDQTGSNTAKAKGQTNLFTDQFDYLGFLVLFILYYYAYEYFANLNLVNSEMYIFLSQAFLLIAIVLGRLSQIIFLPLIVYTLVAKKDFFLPEDFKIKRLFTYNFINMLQLLFLQIFVYVSILNLDEFLLFIDI